MKKDKIKNFTVWSEGYRATGEYATATFHGTIQAKSFKKACHILFKGNKDYDKKRNTLWGCKLFDNEHAARQLCG